MRIFISLRRFPIFQLVLHDCDYCVSLSPYCAIRLGLPWVGSVAIEFGRRYSGGYLLGAYVMGRRGLAWERWVEWRQRNGNSPE
jgi:hypothetical protein